MVYPLTKYTLFAFLRWFVREANGLENVPKDKPFIIAANHESELDSLLIAAVIMPKINKKIHFLAVKRLFRSKLRTLVWRKWGGAIPLGKNAIPESLDVLKKGGVIGIFPEGEKLNAELVKAKTGVAKIALEAKVPIIPVGIINTSKILPMNERIPNKLGKIVKINIGKPIRLEKYSKKYNKQILRKIIDDIMLRISKLANKEYC